MGVFLPEINITRKEFCVNNVLTGRCAHSVSADFCEYDCPLGSSDLFNPVNFVDENDYDKAVLRASTKWLDFYFPNWDDEGEK